MRLQDTLKGQKPNTQLLMLRGLIVSLEAEDQAKINEVADKLRTLMAEAGDYGALAIALVAAEYAAKENG